MLALGVPILTSFLSVSATEHGSIFLMMVSDEGGVSLSGWEHGLQCSEVCVTPLQTGHGV